LRGIGGDCISPRELFGHPARMHRRRIAEKSHHRNLSRVGLRHPARPFDLLRSFRLPQNRLYGPGRTIRAQRIVRLMQALHPQALLFLPVRLAVRGAAELAVGDLSVKRQAAVAIQAAYVISP